MSDGFILDMMRVDVWRPVSNKRRQNEGPGGERAILTRDDFEAFKARWKRAHRKTAS